MTTFIPEMELALDLERQAVGDFPSYMVDLRASYIVINEFQGIPLRQSDRDLLEEGWEGSSRRYVARATGCREAVLIPFPDQLHADFYQALALTLPETYGDDGIPRDVVIQAICDEGYHGFKALPHLVFRIQVEHVAEIVKHAIMGHAIDQGASGCDYLERAAHVIMVLHETFEHHHAQLPHPVREGCKSIVAYFDKVEQQIRACIAHEMGWDFEPPPAVQTGVTP